MQARSKVSIPINLYHEVAWDLGVPTIVDYWRTIGMIWYVSIPINGT